MNTDTANDGFDRFLESLQRVKQVGVGKWVASCPVAGHGQGRGDIHPSLSIDRGNGSGLLINCKAGCRNDDIIAGVGFTWPELLPRRDGRPVRNTAASAPASSTTPLTVKALSLAKGIDEPFLRKQGLKDTPKGVFIEYRTMDGSPALRQRLRTTLTAKKGSIWLGPESEKVVPYGLDRLLDAREQGFLVLVEGESDCWTLWLRGFPALGIPGAAMASKIEPEHIAGIPEIYCWREPDKGGDTFAAGVVKRLREIGYTGRIMEMKLEGVKDPSDLYLASPGKFNDVFLKAIAEAATVEMVTQTLTAPVAGNPTVKVEVVASTESEEDFHPTDLWSAGLFTRLHKDKVRYCERLGGWYYFDGKRWARGVCGEVEQLAKDTARTILEMASSESNDRLRGEMAKHSLRMESAEKLAAMLKLASTEAGIIVPPGAFDAQPWLFNVANGTLDLRAGELRSHRPEDMLTNISPAKWRGPDVKAERFEMFLSESQDGDREKIGFLKRAAGYTLSGDMREQIFMFLYGPEAAGKGTFVRAIAGVMGTYAQSAEITTFLKMRNRSPVRNDVACLYGSRLVTASEPEEGESFDEGLIKVLTGQDVTKARLLYREGFDFTATFKLWFQGNHRPHLKSTLGPMVRRLRIVPFARTVPEDRRDKTLGNTLASSAERSGILAWMVQGCLDWQREGLRTPDPIRAAVEDYRTEEDHFAPYLEERTGRSGAGQVTKGDLYVDYKNWAEKNGERPISKRMVNSRMEELGFDTRDRIQRGIRVWKGIFLVDQGNVVTHG